MSTTFRQTLKRVLPHTLWHERRSRELLIVFFLLLGYLTVRGVEWASLWREDVDAQRIQQEKASRILTAAEKEFDTMQRGLRRVATELARNSVILDYLSGRTTDVAPLFDVVGKTSSEEDIAVEIYDRDERLLAWEGHSGILRRKEVRIALDGQLTSSVSRNGMTSYLFLTMPVREEGRIVGALLVRRLLQVRYPANNRFIAKEGISDRLFRELGVNVEFSFGDNAEAKKDGRYVSSTLYGIDSTVVGVVSVLRPGRAQSLESSAQRFQTLKNILLALSLLVAAFALGRQAVGFRRPGIRSAVIASLILLVRYGLIALEVPSSFSQSGIFDPARFASPFGGGLASSVVELTLTVAAFSFLFAFIVREIVLSNAEARLTERLTHVPALVRWLIALLSAGLMFWIVRGFGAVLKSGVDDSVFRYLDPRVIQPSFDLALMMADLVMISVCMTFLGMCTAWWIARLIRPRPAPFAPQGWDWFWTLLVLLGTAIAFAHIQNTPLMSAGVGVGFALSIVLLAAYLARQGVTLLEAIRWRNVLPLFGLSAVFFYILLNGYVQEKDRDRIETFAGEYVRPVDYWFTSVIDNAFQSFEATAGDAIIDSDPDELSALAFNVWSTSLACREGYTSVFEIADTNGILLSQFQIGGQIPDVRNLDVRSFHEPEHRILTIGSGINAVRLYSGSTPIFSSDSQFVGVGRATVVAGRNTLFRGENPAILRGSTGETPETFYRSVTIAGYTDGILESSNNQDLPIGYTLPEGVLTRLNEPGHTMTWGQEVVDGKSFETVYVRREGAGNEVVALGLESPGIVWHLVNTVKTALGFLAVLLLLAAGWYVKRRMFGVRPGFSFRDKLLVALLSTAVVPLILVMAYGRYFALDRLIEIAGSQLEDQTSAVAQYLADQQSDTTRHAPRGMTQTDVEQIASDLGTDFNVYQGPSLQWSSRPELFQAGILDTRASGTAYANVVVRGKRFFMQSERIGSTQYAVGYRPMVDDAGAITGMISVPTLYRQDQLEEEITRRTAFLFGVYALVIFALVAVATTFANRIAAPIQRLTEATRRIAAGELDVPLHVPRANDEIGELVRSFVHMSRRLKRNREDLVRYERELAWKEMAKQVAHEIKNPLTPMKLSVQHLRRTYRDKAPDFGKILEDVTKTVMEQIDTLSRIASEFSNFARMPKRHLEPCDVSTTVSEAAQLFDQESRIHFAIHSAREALVVSADREELRRAFINIFRNSIQAMENAGDIVVTIERSGADAAIAIRDFGPGIPQEMRDKLFQPNFSTKTEGMGLGLAIVKKCVDDMNGRITMEDAQGGGTVVRMALPLEGAS